MPHLLSHGQTTHKSNGRVTEYKNGAALESFPASSGHEHKDDSLHLTESHTGHVAPSQKCFYVHRCRKQILVGGALATC